MFEKYGDVEKCNIMRDPHTRESRGFGFVKMMAPEQADAAKDGLQGEVIEGRTLSIEKARRARPRTPTPGKYYGPPKRGNPHRPYRCICCVLTFTQKIDALAAVVAEDMGIVTTIAVAVMIGGRTGDIVAQDMEIVMRNAVSMVDVTVKIIRETLIATRLLEMIVTIAEVVAAAVVVVEEEEEEVEAAGAVELITSVTTVVLAAIPTEVIVKATAADRMKIAKTDILVDKSG